MVKTGTSKRHYCILHVWITLSAKFHFAQTILNFGTTFAYKRYFCSKTKNVNITIELCILEFVWLPNFTSNKQFWILGRNLPKKSIWPKTKKVNITIEGCFEWGAMQICMVIITFLVSDWNIIMNITNAFCMFELFWVLHFTLYKHFWVFTPHSPKKGIFGQELKKRISLFKSAHSNKFMH